MVICGYRICNGQTINSVGGLTAYAQQYYLLREDEKKNQTHISPSHRVPFLPQQHDRLPLPKEPSSYQNLTLPQNTHPLLALFIVRVYIPPIRM